MGAIRADAARSRARILEVARRHDATRLRLNDVAREAGLGVGTVYRHFPTVRSLVEALSIDSLRRLGAAAHDAAAEPDPLVALRRFVDDALALQLADPGLQAVLVELERADPAVHTECSAARAQVNAGYAAVLARAQAAGAVRPNLTATQLQRLVCGVEHAVRLGTPDDRPVLLDILIAGIRA
ncbi:helix-turn-helix domain-containing protein [Microbacterium sp. 10M-3C3]|uniref:TetR/AcrR family transcriptional regulator n=1 Tax=Microbacterium sp. 10M-3C3 TaxID=2483401 RepID=UPI000F640FE3|nr:helix-turn-helix domain-containing protein [Microbacterium sp. 10M-3C3]